jgi:hypothetical protein
MMLPMFRTLLLVTVAAACVEPELAYTTDDREILTGVDAVLW